MTEDRLQQVERELDGASAGAAAAVAFAAIHRLGEVGPIGAELFGRLARGSFNDPDTRPFADGWRAIAAAVAAEAMS